MIVILGAGLAGLSAAYHLRRGGCRQVALYEREARPGGLCRSETVEGYTFDRTGHFLHLREPGMKRLVGRWLGDDLPEVVRRSSIFSHDGYTPYPFQTNTYRLPVEVRKEVILGYVEALYGQNDWSREPADDQGLPEPEKSFERWVYETSGAGIARHFMLPYNDKLYGVHPRFLTTEWMGRFMPPTPLEKVVEGALTDQTEAVGYNATFRYPRRGGIEAVVQALAERAGPIELGCEAVAIDAKQRQVAFADGSTAGYQSLVSTLPLARAHRPYRGRAQERGRGGGAAALLVAVRREPRAVGG
ncbi:MAG: protoporphyrinogen/coproporphyrinogen oxidase, partial [bacterium]